MTESIVFLDRDTIAPHTKIRRPSFDHTWNEFGKSSPHQVPARLRGATIAITNKALIGEATIQQCPDLKLIAVAATGYDIVDTSACEKYGVSLTNVRNYSKHSVPEHTFALILALTRQIFGYCEDIKKGEWGKAGQFCFFNHRINDLYGKRLIIIGKGSIGTAVGRIAEAFGMEVHFSGRKGVADAGLPYTPWDKCIAIGDIFTIHCPLDPSTAGMFGIHEFSCMKDSAIIINTSRGNIVVEEDLINAIEKKIIGGAALDVIKKEPPENDSPLIKTMKYPNFILTPHIGWSSTEAMQTLVDQVIQNIENFLAGKPSNIVV